jgi:hypothetical protein
MRRNATREIVQVDVKTRRERTWTVFGNHWPSRSGGQFESSGYRDIPGETLRTRAPHRGRVGDRTHAAHGW